ncbi:DUF3082 domain-containing protein [Planktothrix sp. FACHB-1355]|uniref:DUF3082 domain-containing protein n=1 Tax=Aerosakkonema funiforme FACHB-1375 TaxID=2949571 RepID=A0A926VAQ0_9CYAN|nr:MULTISPECIES: DUF3082 domain-containing protein [Oscillatoriales]MBD2180394.1 DUF3082 domain-containing protein [Aerosakkonema funiforme FACHB-1375]MBD3558106.1 DUF3082 domain-containing protein [Planktothrix sp. FACHB-1355]
MNNPTPTQNTPSASDLASPSSPSPLRCLIGSLIATGMTIGLYFLTSSIAQTFAAKPIQSHNVTVINITVAVRTLVVGISSLATFVFGIIAIGLIALAIQISIQQVKNQPAPPQN